jgi:hypothetical protein
VDRDRRIFFRLAPNFRANPGSGLPRERFSRNLPETFPWERRAAVTLFPRSFPEKKIFSAQETPREYICAPTGRAVAARPGTNLLLAGDTTKIGWRTVRLVEDAVRVHYCQSCNPPVVMEPRGEAAVCPDCPDDLRRERILARPPWRSRDIDKQTEFGRWLRSNIADRVDTSQGTPETAATAITAWVTGHMTAGPGGNSR